jgi:hypothetical protein
MALTTAAEVQLAAADDVIRVTGADRRGGLRDGCVTVRVADARQPRGRRALLLGSRHHDRRAGRERSAYRQRGSRREGQDAAGTRQEPHGGSC